MSHLVSCKGLSKSYGPRKLFDNIDLVVHVGDCVGLIGPNGSGKSTLLKILCDLETSDRGNVLRQKQTRLSYLSQVDNFVDEKSLVDNLLLSLDGEPLNDVEKYTAVQKLLSRAEFEDFEQPVSSLSGGWRKRLSICRSLLIDPDIVIMDEPTNHLDIEGIVWLEKLLKSGAGKLGAYIIVSHDRKFLENCTNSIIELSSLYPDGLLRVQGNYPKFLEERELFLESQALEEERLENKMRREVDWLSRGPKARSTKAKYRIDEAHRLISSVSDVKTRNNSLKQVEIDFEGTGRRTKKLLEGTGLTKGYDGNKLFEDLDIILTPGSKLGLLGRNGCGKSSLMHILAAANLDERPMDSGKLSCADKIRIVSFDQDRSGINPNINLRDALSPDGDSIMYQGRSIHVVSWAKRFLFRVDQLDTPVSQLSGGEQARILIAELMRQPADILLLDEPTNDLDIPSLNVLEESLVDFPGALVLVSHDRFLLDRVCGNLLGFGAHDNPVYYASYKQWLDDMEVKKHPAKAAKENDKVRAKKKGPGKGKLSYMDQREYDTIEVDISVAEDLVGNFETELSLPKVAQDSIKVAEVWQKLEDAKQKVETLYARWEELEEKKESN
ncbi:MAG: ABC-F family ATP-binding cassette domain-containing protein [Desulfotalea sp.]